MYTSFFNLLESPFSIAPNPRYLYMSPRHEEALAHLLYGVKEGGGFVSLTGEVGTGKTTLCHCLIEQLPNNVDIAFILNPRLNASELLASICDELRIPYPTNTQSLKVLIDALNKYLLSAHASGRRTILMIDEAQNLSFEVLEQIRLLTNLETTQSKLLQIILIGQPELNQFLMQKQLRQLTQRITARYHLEPLSYAETTSYIQHRIAIAGSNEKLFSQAAVRKIYHYSKGIPRLINIISDRALLGAFSTSRRCVNKRIVRNAADEVLHLPKQTMIFFRPVYWLPAVLLLIAIFGGLYFNAFASLDLYKFLTTSSEPAYVSEINKPSTNQRVSGRPKPTTTKFPIQDEDDNKASYIVAVNNSKTDKKLHQTETLPLFSDLIKDPKYTLPRAFSSLFLRWGIQSIPKDYIACSDLVYKSLRCLNLRGTWNLLRQLDRPAILELTLNNGYKRYANLIAMKNHDPVLRFGYRNLTFPLAEVLSYWRGHFVILWKPPSADITILTPGQRSPSVLWLRQQLTKTELPISLNEKADYYDVNLKKLVQQFQRKNGLLQDGIAGPRTLIFLNTAMNNRDIPRLEAIQN